MRYGYCWIVRCTGAERGFGVIYAAAEPPVHRVQHVLGGGVVVINPVDDPAVAFIPQ